MAIFRRRPKGDDEPQVTEEQVEAQASAGQEAEGVDDDAAEATAAGTGTDGRPAHGPWDAADEATALPRLDLGALHIPGVPGMELRMEVDKTTNAVSAAAVSIDGSTLQLQAYAAPRSEGIWDEIRQEIQQSVVQQGGAADDLPGPFGRELLARLPARTPEGRTAHRPARFLGVDGPRWFLRGVITGRAAVEPDAAQVLERVFGEVVVVRGTDARPPRDLLTLTLPNRQGPGAPAVEEPPAAQEPDFDPLTRGPEITEIR
ncbi:DUF3710 domain-containing protein [Cellulomonas palmilytica]|uniref:DUF3710 domain-containing protein n=1 Tax=Cellulomonas palmilytica TaxID=2608402 RepID=UPI001F2A9E55|nr:DUF3710 domain-containing protein [Cellulomonas palmilytica]UJP39185.1 DUF3710 domain-containing protein [Cellulomonas palmilytica]